MKALSVIILSLLVGGCSCSSTKDRLWSIAQRHDPAHLSLTQAFNSYVRSSRLEDGTELGIITMKDGSSAKYWFRSHHLSHDMCGTWFRMSTGETSYMAGYFCCEVQLPDKQLQSLDALKAFIQQHDRINH